MARKETGIRGIDGSLLAKVRAIVKSEYGKTKDRNGSIIARIINSMLSEYVVLHKEKVGSSRKSQTKKILDTILRALDLKELDPARMDHYPAIIRLIKDITGTEELRTIIKYVVLLERSGFCDLLQRERIINKAYSLYGVSRRIDKHAAELKSVRETYAQGVLNVLGKIDQRDSEARK